MKTNKTIPRRGYRTEQTSPGTVFLNFVFLSTCFGFTNPSSNKTVTSDAFVKHKCPESTCDSPMLNFVTKSKVGQRSRSFLYI